MRIIIIWLGLFSSLSCYAKLDFTLHSSYRTAPITGALDMELGKGFSLWGKGALEGILRPYIKSQFSDGYQAYGGGLDLYIFRFLGLKLNYLDISNKQNYPSFDCSTYECNDNYTNIGAEAFFAIKLGFLFSKFSYKLNQYNPSKNDKRFVVPFIGLSLDISGERYSTQEGIIGLRIFRSTALFYRYEKFENNIESAYQRLAILRTSLSENLFLSIGVG